MIPQLIFSILLLISIFYTAFNLEVGEVGLVSNLNALLIVLGGTLAATLIGYPSKKVIWTFQLLKKAFLARDDIDSTINTIVDLARAYRQGGIRTLEQKGENLPQGLPKGEASNVRGNSCFVPCCVGSQRAIPTKVHPKE